MRREPVGFWGPAGVIDNIMSQLMRHESRIRYQTPPRHCRSHVLQNGECHWLGVGEHLSLMFFQQAAAYSSDIKEMRDRGMWFTPSLPSDAFFSCKVSLLNPHKVRFGKKNAGMKFKKKMLIWTSGPSWRQCSFWKCILMSSNQLDLVFKNHSCKNPISS